MKISNLDLVQGNNIEIFELRLSYEHSQCNLTVKCFCKNNEVMIQCMNVSDLNIQNLSAPMQINGFEILSNKSRGWESRSNYTIHDFEGNRMEFFCEHVEIIKLTN